MEYSKKYILKRDIHASTAMRIVNAVDYTTRHVYPGIKIEVKESSTQQTTEPTKLIELLAASNRFQKDSEVEIIVSGEFPKERLVEVADYIGKLFSKDE